ncbi:MAG: zf-TFIIB domain-containing protein [Thermoplasmatota archaeon]
MKGKTTCPNCKHEFVMDLTDDKEIHRIECPQCTHAFRIKRKCEADTEECGWEEHGEPRKTILSAMRKHTNKPAIVSFLLLSTGILGIFTALLFVLNNELNLTEFEFIVSYFNMMGNIFFSIPLFIFSIIAIIGSITAFKRRNFLFTFLCSILAIFSIGFFIGTVLSIIAVLLLFVSQDDFHNGAKGKEF